MVEHGESPARSKRTAVAERKVADERRVTFRAFAQRWIEETLFYRSAGYVAQIVRGLAADVTRPSATWRWATCSRAHPRDHPATQRGPRRFA